MIIYKPIEIKWMIMGYPNYGFGTDKSLYSLKTGRIFENDQVKFDLAEGKKGQMAVNVEVIN